jgi:adenylyl cyclase-associated protein
MGESIQFIIAIMLIVPLSPSGDGRVDSGARSGYGGEDFFGTHFVLSPFARPQAMGESIPALGWVMVEKTPAPHVNEMWQCGEFNQQKIIMAYKGKDETQVSYK